MNNFFYSYFINALRVSFRNFLITTVKNKCNDYLRKKQSELKWETQYKSVGTSIPEEIYTLQELQTMIEAALQKLPEKIRTAFEMNRFRK